MFSFHKPKVYRSPSGCCICKAKSSSSRFTDSKKYESDFVECFQLQEPRSGEVCNACVLLVKRWKKLPEGSQRNWRHVVDARAGPGTKSATKFKSKQKRKAKSKSATATVMAATAGLEEEVEEEKEKERRRRRSKAIMEVEEEEEELDEQMREQSPSSALSDEIIGGDLSDLSVPPSPTPSEDAPSQLPLFHPPHRTRSMLKRLAPPLPLPAVSGFIDTNFWKREKVCCGIVFKGPNGQIIIDSRFFKPCHARRQQQQQQQQQPPHDVVPQVATTTPPPPPPPLTNTTTTTTTTAKVAASTTTSPPYSDTSSDSGYDESSNQSSEVTSSLIIVGPSVPPLPVTAAANNNNNSNN